MSYDLPLDFESSPLFEPTYTISQLGSLVDELLKSALPSVWVVGEIHRLRPHSRGHLYFELVEKGEGDSVIGKLDAVLWRSERQKVEMLLSRTSQRLSEGLTIRCRATLSFYPPYGRVQLEIREIDPAFSLGQLAKRRAETLAELARLGLLDRNRQLRVPELPLRVGVVTAIGSAAYRDFTTTLAESRYPFRLWVAGSSVQGREAGREIPRALELLSAVAELDVIVLIRGGGARSDLAAFDSRAVAMAVANCPRPVFTGLGHEIDVSVADQVAFRSFKTPTAVAEFLVTQVREQEIRLKRLEGELARVTRLPLSEARSRIALLRERILKAATTLRSRKLDLFRRVRILEGMVQRYLGVWRGRLEDRRHGLVRVVLRGIEAGARRRGYLEERLRLAARNRLSRARQELESRKRLAASLSLARTLERGFSITRGPDGRALRSTEGLTVGMALTTELARGRLESKILEME
jgi:exodeoxyribonuclease VII large subunit